MVESVAFGLGYATVLVWVGAAFVGSFGYNDDAYPYWPAIPHLRTDTAGFNSLARSFIAARSSSVNPLDALPALIAGSPFLIEMGRPERLAVPGKTAC